MLTWLLISVVIVFCALCQKWGAASLRWLLSSRRRHEVRGLEREMRRRAAGTGFDPAHSFLPHGVGLALDPARRLLFLAARDWSGLRSTLVPFAALRTVKCGETSDTGFYDHYVDVTVRDGVRESWRLLCGGNKALAAEMALVLRGVRERPGFITRA
jgi:hypothetical protein